MTDFTFERDDSGDTFGADTTTSTDFVDVTGHSMTLPNRSRKKVFIAYHAQEYNTSTHGYSYLRLVKGSSPLNSVDNRAYHRTHIAGAQRRPIKIHGYADADGEVIKAQFAQNSGGSAGILGSGIWILMLFIIFDRR